MPRSKLLIVTNSRGAEDEAKKQQPSSYGRSIMMFPHFGGTLESRGRRKPVNTSDFLTDLSISSTKAQLKTRSNSVDLLQTLSLNSPPKSVRSQPILKPKTHRLQNDIKSTTKSLSLHRKSNLPAAPISLVQKTNAVLLRNKPLPAICSSTVPELPLLSDIQQVLYGYFGDDLPKQESRSMRVFLSSTFSDMKAERNAIWMSVFPKVRQYCTRHNIDFSLVDMRWGVVDHATDHHFTGNLCVEETKRCVENCCAISFISLIGQRYGHVAVPSSYPAHLFEKVLSFAQSENYKSSELLQKWFKRDENAVPPVYILQPISSILQDYASLDADRKSAAIREWKRQSSDLWTVMYQSAKHAFEQGQFSQEELNKLEKSVTVTEVEAGIINNKNSSNTTLAFQRHLNGVEESVLNDAGKFVDLTNDNDGTLMVSQDTKSKIKRYITDPIQTILPSTAIRKYDVSWRAGGIPPDTTMQTEEEHEYLDQLADDMCEILTAAVDEKVKSLQQSTEDIVLEPSDLDPHICDKTCARNCPIKRNTISKIEDDDPQVQTEFKLSHSLYIEILSHLQFGYQQSKLFCGRPEDVQKVYSYLSSNESQHEPLLVWAESGRGKTYLSAKIVTMARDKFHRQGVIIVRFLGTTAESSNIYSVIKSVCTQLSLVYRLHFYVSAMTTMFQLIKKFHKLLNKISAGNYPEHLKKLIIALDAMDQLTERYNPHLWKWLPRLLPPNVFIIVTFPPWKNKLLSNAQLRFSNFMEVSPVNMNSVEEFSALFYRQTGKKLTDKQIEIVGEKIRQNPYALYSRMLIDIASQWHSYTIPSELPKTAEEAISTLFGQLELEYGKTFVSHALSFITIGYMGIGESELQDAMSCDDHLLTEVYTYHPPPVQGVVRFPVHLWPLVHQRLDEYLVVRQSRGLNLISWYSSVTFTKASTERYLTGESYKHYHKLLAQLFSIEHGLKRTITLSKLRQPITVNDADRQIGNMPLNKSSHRKLECMVYHLTRAADMNELLNHTFCNLRYILAAWQAFSLSQIIQWAMEAKLLLGANAELQLLIDYFKFTSRDVFGNKEPSEDIMTNFAAHIIGCLPSGDDHPHLQSLVEQAKQWLNTVSSLIIPATQCLRGGHGVIKNRIDNVDAIGFVDHISRSLALRDSMTGNIQYLDTNYMQCISVTDIAEFRAMFLAPHALHILTDKEIIFQPLEKGSIRSEFNTNVQELDSKSDNQCIAVGVTSRLVCLATTYQIVMYSSKGESMNEPMFSVARTVILEGIESTEALCFSVDEQMTISVHTSSGGEGVVVCWDHKSAVIKKRCVLPAVCMRDQLYTLPDNDRIVCAYVNNHIAVWSHTENCITETVYTGGPWDCLVVDEENLAVSCGSKVQMWTFNNITQTIGISLIKDSASIALQSKCNRLYVGFANGSIELYDTLTGALIKSMTHLCESITNLSVISEEFLVVLDCERRAALFDIDLLVKDIADYCTDYLVHPASKHGNFSAHGSKVAVQYKNNTVSVIDMENPEQNVNVTCATGCSGEVQFMGNFFAICGLMNSDILNVWSWEKNSLEAELPDVIAYLTDARGSITLVRKADDGCELVYWKPFSDEQKVVILPDFSSDVLLSDCESMTAVTGTTSTDSKIILISCENIEVIASNSVVSTVCKLACNEHGCIYMSVGKAAVLNEEGCTDLEFDVVSAVGTTHSHYIVAHSANSVTILSKALELLQTVCISNNVVDILANACLPSGHQLLALSTIKTDVLLLTLSPHDLSVKLSNPLQTSCHDLRAVFSLEGEKLHVYGQAYDMTRLMTFSVRTAIAPNLLHNNSNAAEENTERD